MEVGVHRLHIIFDNGVFDHSGGSGIFSLDGGGGCGRPISITV